MRGVPAGYQTMVALLSCGWLLLGASFSHAQTYDPLAVSPQAVPQLADLNVHDARRQRDIPIRVYLPSQRTASPVILFSHGLGGSREDNPYLGRHWASRGYVAAFLQHAGGSEAELKSGREAGNLHNLQLRAGDVAAVLDQLQRWNSDHGHLLAGRLNLRKVGMSGHSFGAMTTQAVSGQRYDKGRALFTDTRISAALILSPTAPKGGSAEAAFGRVSIPWMLMTGSKDTAHVEYRLAVFPALPDGHKYELVLEGAKHLSLTDQSLPTGYGTRNPNHHRAILALSTAFWDLYLRNDSAAKAWLQGHGPRELLEAGDRWQMK